MIKALFLIFPIKRWQYFLLQHHHLGCPECKKDIASIEEARSVIFPIEKVKIEEIFWQQFEQRLKADEEKRKAFWPLRWKWAVGITVLLAVAFVLVFKLTPLFKNKVPDLAVKLRINYIELYEKPAQAFIFQTQDANRTFIWVEKRIKGETQ
jgi:hypothetical protein